MANWEQVQHLCSTHLHHSAITDAEYPMCLFTFILKDIAEKTNPKTSTVPKRFNKLWFTDIYKAAILSATGPLIGSNVNQPGETWMRIALLGLKLAEISDTVRKHLGEMMSPR